MRSPLSGSPIVPAQRRMSSISKEEDYGFAETSNRQSSYGQLASAFIHPRRSSSSRPSATAGNSRSSLGHSLLANPPTPLEDPEDQAAQDAQETNTPSHAGLVTPHVEAPEVATPSGRENQDPQIPNIDLGGYEGDTSKYQSGMTVSISQRADQVEQEPSVNWSSPVSQQQRDLARMLGQSSAKIMHRPSSPDSEADTERTSRAVSDVAQKLANSRLDGDGEAERKDALSNDTSSAASPNAKGTADSGLIASDAEQTMRIGGRSFPDSNLSPSGEALQTIPLTASLDGLSKTIKNAIQITGMPPSSPTSQVEAKTPISGSSTSEAKSQPSLSHRENTTTSFKASLPQLVEEDAHEPGATLFTNTEPFNASESSNPRRPAFTATATLKPADQPLRTLSARERLNSAASEDLHRYDVDARQQSEALRMKAVWAEKQHLTAPKQPPNDVHRRLKAMSVPSFSLYSPYFAYAIGVIADGSWAWIALERIYIGRHWIATLG